MKQYKISFYKSKKDWVAASIYYREFATIGDLYEWCKDFKDSCNYAFYTIGKITKSEFLKYTL